MMRTRWVAVATGLFGLAGLALFAFALPGHESTAAPLAMAATAQAPQPFSLDPDTLVGWARGPAQPIFFSHRRHAGAFKIDCLYCHSNTDKSQVAPMPTLTMCLGCHRIVKSQSPEIEKVRGYMERGEPVSWMRVYKLADFVQFNHGRHIRAKIECKECHGDVEEYDVIWRWSPLTMGWCLECHKEPPEDEAQIERARLLAERYGREGREPRGLYSLSIDSHYGVLKGPIDCAACHH
jgi:hypothetical protein